MKKNLKYALDGVGTPIVCSRITNEERNMPNQRQEDKRKVGVWLDPAEWAALEEAAKELGLSKSDILKSAIEAKIKQEQSNGRKGK